jgi:hypothetical protein
MDGAEFEKIAAAAAQLRSASCQESSPGHGMAATGRYAAGMHLLRSSWDLTFFLVLGSRPLPLHLHLHLGLTATPVIELQEVRHPCVVSLLACWLQPPRVVQCYARPPMWRVGKSIESHTQPRNRPAVGAVQSRPFPPDKVSARHLHN